MNHPTASFNRLPGSGSGPCYTCGNPDAWRFYKELWLKEPIPGREYCHKCYKQDIIDTDREIRRRDEQALAEAQENQNNLSLPTPAPTAPTPAPALRQHRQNDPHKPLHQQSGHHHHPGTSRTEIQSRSTRPKMNFVDGPLAAKMCIQCRVREARVHSCYPGRAATWCRWCIKVDWDKVKKRRGSAAAEDAASVQKDK